MGSYCWGRAGVPPGAPVGRLLGRRSEGTERESQLSPDLADGCCGPPPVARAVVEPTRPGRGSTEAPPAAAPSRPRRAGGCAPPRSSPSRGSGGHSGARSAGTRGSGGPAGAAVGRKGGRLKASSPLGPRRRGVMRSGGWGPHQGGLPGGGRPRHRGQEVRESPPCPHALPWSSLVTHQHQAVSAAPKGDGLRNHGRLLLLHLLLKVGEGVRSGPLGRQMVPGDISLGD